MEYDENYIDGLYYLEQSEMARDELSKIHGLDILSENIQIALGEVLDIEPMLTHLHLNQKRLTANQMIELLKEYDFNILQPVVLEAIELDFSIIPDNTPRLLTEEVIRCNNEKWVVHKNDADPFPPVHAHNYESQLKLDLSTGSLYTNHNKYVSDINCKTLKKIRSKFKIVTLPPLGQRCQ
ncbi:MAG: hypothetical protein PHQ24_11075 [Proteiniphilum sp.]|jgi:hypothetical protein|nr:hypothetical protein [Proteiniphilum sp.]